MKKLSCMLTVCIALSIVFGTFTYAAEADAISVRSVTDGNAGTTAQELLDAIDRGDTWVGPLTVTMLRDPEALFTAVSDENLQTAYEKKDELIKSAGVIPEDRELISAEFVAAANVEKIVEENGFQPGVWVFSLKEGENARYAFLVRYRDGEWEAHPCYSQFNDTYVSAAHVEERYHHLMTYAERRTLRNAPADVFVLKLNLSDSRANETAQKLGKTPKELQSAVSGVKVGDSEVTTVDVAGEILLDANGKKEDLVRGAGLVSDGMELDGVDILGAVDVIYDMSSSKSVTLSLKVADVSTSGNYAFLHYASNGWEVIPASVSEDGTTLTGTFTSLSPVIAVRLNVKAGDNDDDDNDDDTGAETAPVSVSGPTSPKTGETIPTAGVLAVICMAGAVVCIRKNLQGRSAK